MDYHSTTPVDPRVVEAMLPYFTETFGNAASVDHLYGHNAQQAVERAREVISGAIGACKPEEVIFTSGATESDNIALVGIAEAYEHKGNHIVTTAIEHKAILDTLEYLTRRGFRTTIVPVDRYGMVDPADIEKAITNQTILVSVMLANNEIGTLQPVKEIGRIAREHGVFFHTDAAQAVGHVPVDVEDMNIDLMSFTAHKLCGPKGVGALYVKRRRPRVKPAPVIHGGGHERGIRSGTLNVPGIVGFAKALEISTTEMDLESERLWEWTEWMLKRFQSRIDGVERNGHPVHRLPHNLNVFIPGIESKALVLELNNVMAFSTGSACTSANVEPSHVILALGRGEERAHSSVRFGLGRFTSQEEVELAVNAIVTAVSRLEDKFSPLGRPK
jgi:cysteine desulfurase